MNFVAIEEPHGKGERLKRSESWVLRVQAEPVTSEGTWSNLRVNRPRVCGGNKAEGSWEIWAVSYEESPVGECARMGGCAGIDPRDRPNEEGPLPGAGRYSASGPVGRLGPVRG